MVCSRANGLAAGRRAASAGTEARQATPTALNANPRPWSQGPLPSEPPRPMAAWSDWRHVIQGLEGLPRNRAAPEMVQALASAVEARAAGADMVSALPVEAMRQNVLMHGST